MILVISWIMISTESKAIQWIPKCYEHQIRYLLRRDVYQWNVLYSTTEAKLSHFGTRMYFVYA